MITTRFKEVVWTGGICAATLSFYMISQTVAAKRAEITSVEQQIAATRQEIGRLRTEISTRAGVTQIEKWNQSVYGLVAPGPEQFVTSSVRLASLVQPAPAPLPLDPGIVASHGALNKVSYDRIEDGSASGSPARTVAAAPQPVAQPALRQANYVQPKAPALAPEAPAAVHTVAHKTLKPALGDDFIDGLTEEAPASHKGRR